MPELRIGDLRAPFPPDCVHWRVGATNADKSKGIALAYIDARDVMERLDQVVGPENWQCDYPHAGEKTVCRIGIRIKDEWVWKSNGAGDTDVEGAKGALSDAFKRAAVLWGIGQYLYDIETPWVALNQKGRSYVIAPTEYTRLHKLVGGKAANNLRGSKEWEKFVADLVDCKSEITVNKLYGQIKADGWPAQWLSEAKRECKARIESFDNDPPLGANDGFPGDTQSTLQAG